MTPALSPGPGDFVSFTGGEPLLQPEPLAALARAFREHGPRIHLETHGLHTDALASVLPEIDVVSMDWKLASDVRRASDPKTGVVDDFHAAHADFLDRFSSDAMGAAYEARYAALLQTRASAEVPHRREASLRGY